MSLKEISKNYYRRLSDLLGQTQATQKDGVSMDFFSAAEFVGQLAMTQTENGKKIIFIGNGASASISSHMATDYWKNSGMRAMAFNDAALLTCLSNDCGYENVFGKSVEMFAMVGSTTVRLL
jgi:D-sedoheptulose 7-phosphate isomerase